MTVVGGLVVILKTTHIGMEKRAPTKLDVLVLRLDLVRGIISTVFILLICIGSVTGTHVMCNCDDQKTGLIDDNVLYSMDQLPIKGQVKSVLINCDIK